MDGVQNEAPARVAARGRRRPDSRLNLGGFFDEMFDDDRKPRLRPRRRRAHRDVIPGSRRSDAREPARDGLLPAHGHRPSTSTGRRRGTERIFPFDLDSRVIDAADLAPDSRPGLIQRVRALNAFVETSTAGEILDGRRRPARPGARLAALPARRRSACSRRSAIFAHVAGIDLVRDDDGRFFVLEDNLRTPSGVSLRAREPRGDEAHCCPSCFARSGVRRVEELPRRRCSRALRAAAPRGESPTDRRRC